MLFWIVRLEFPRARKLEIRWRKVNRGSLQHICWVDGDLNPSYRSASTVWKNRVCFGSVENDRVIILSNSYTNGI